MSLSQSLIFIKVLKFYTLRNEPEYKLFIRLMNTPLAPLHPQEEPKATSKHTLCGYAWSDVTSALIRAIGTADNARAQRWAAELVCSEQGLGRLEATLVDAWAVHVGPAYPTWCRTWYNSIHQLRSAWTKSGGDIKAVRNTPTVRQLVAESVAALILAAKKPLPTLPTSADCFREAEGMRSRLRSGGGVGDQLATRRVWVAGQDGADLRTIGNELEAALRSAQISRLLFWIIWMITLDGQTDAPTAKERGPAHLSPKQRKSILWFLITILRELANEGAYLSVEDRNGIWGLLELTWPKLGARGRRDAIVTIALCVQDHLQRRGSLTLSGSTNTPALSDIRRATSTIDTIYSNPQIYVMNRIKFIKHFNIFVYKPIRKYIMSIDPAFNALIHNLPNNNFKSCFVRIPNVAAGIHLEILFRKYH